MPTVTLPDAFTCRSGRILRKLFLRTEDLTYEKRDDIKDVATCIAKLLDWQGTPSREYLGQKADKTELISFLKRRLEEENASDPFPLVREPVIGPLAIDEPEEIQAPVVSRIESPVVQGTNGHSPVASNEGLAAFGALISPYIAKPDVDLGELRQRVNTELNTVGERFEAMRDELSEHFEKLISEMPARRIEIITPEKTVIDVTEEHEMFSVLFRLLELGCHVWLVGPAGSGKTTATEKIAERLGLEYAAESMSSQTTKSDLKGFINASGVYIPSSLYERYVNGGLWLADEFDAGNANCSMVLNALLANDQCSFPNGMQRRHSTFRCVANSNTFGTGASRQYVGTNQVNEATRDRFCFLEWPYDEQFEARLSGGTVKARTSVNPFLAPGTSLGTDEWLELVRRYRQNAEVTKSRVVVSPRASIVGARLLQAGFTKEQCEEMLIFRGCDELTKNKLRGVA